MIPLLGWPSVGTRAQRTEYWLQTHGNLRHIPHSVCSPTLRLSSFLLQVPEVPTSGTCCPAFQHPAQVLPPLGRPPASAPFFQAHVGLERPRVTIWAIAWARYGSQDGRAPTTPWAAHFIDENVTTEAQRLCVGLLPCAFLRVGAAAGAQPPAPLPLRSSSASLPSFPNSSSSSVFCKVHPSAASCRWGGRRSAGSRREQPGALFPGGGEGSGRCWGPVLFPGTQVWVKFRVSCTGRRAGWEWAETAAARPEPLLSASVGSV